MHANIEKTLASALAALTIVGTLASVPAQARPQIAGTALRGATFRRN